MVITFQSRATSDVLMFGEVAARLLSIVGKDAQAAKGIITVEQLPEAIARLQQAIEADRAQARAAERADPDRDENEDNPRGMAAPVSLHQRGWPLLEMMTRSHAEGVPVTWGT
jgi:hypothetical protein